MPAAVVKSDAYGHGMIEVSKTVLKAARFGRFGDCPLCARPLCAPFVSADEGGRCLGILTCEAGHTVGYAGVHASLKEGPVYLKGEMRYGNLQLFYAEEKEQWKPFGPLLDATVIGDEYRGRMRFTGAFAGMCVQDLSGQKRTADFDWFKMERLSSREV